MELFFLKRSRICWGVPVSLAAKICYHKGMSTIKILFDDTKVFSKEITDLEGALTSYCACTFAQRQNGGKA